MNPFQFKAFVIELINGIIAKCDERAGRDAVTIAKLSADATELRGTVDQLQAALSASQDAASKALANQAADQASALDSLSSELQATFNPTPVADAVAVAVEESPVIETPAIVEAAQTLEEPVATEVAVVEAAVEAIAEVAPVE